MKKLEITKKITTEPVNYFLGGKMSLNEVILAFTKRLNDVKNDNSEYPEIIMDFYTATGSYGDSDYLEVAYIGKRMETDEEYNKRLNDAIIRSDAAKKAAITRHITKVKREKTLLENLKKKYETG